MHSLGESPPWEKQIPLYIGVAMVTSGGLVALILILAACSFFRKVRFGGGGESSQPEMYVEEFYSNPAFMDLPFDGSCSKHQDITYDTSIAEFNTNAKEIPTSLHSPLNGSVTSPQAVVAKVPMTAPYQEEPQHFVQENGHTSLEEGDVNCAIETNDGKVLNQLSGERVTEQLEISDSGILPTETVIVNPGALESFKNDEKKSYEVRGKENVENKDEELKECASDSDLNLVNSPRRGHEELKSSEMKQNEGSQQGHCDTIRKEEMDDEVGKEGNICGVEAERDKKRKESHELTGSLNKRVRTSMDDSYISRQNGVTIQRVKKPKMSPKEFPANYSTKKISVGKKSSGVYRKRSRSSFSKVQKPVFRNRRKITQTEDKLAAEVIKNPFTV